MPNTSQLRKTIGSYLGQVLTPEMAAAIEVAAFNSQDNRIDLQALGSVHSGDLVIAAEQIADILDELHPLHLQHWQETEVHRHGLTMNPDYTAMVNDERTGRLIQFTVRKNGVLCGNLRMYLFVSRHTQTLSAKEDTLYLAPEARGGMTAVMLMRFAEKSLLSLGVREIEADSKLVNNADVLMRRLKYTAVALKFSKVFGEKNV